MIRRGRHKDKIGRPWRLSILTGLIIRLGGVVVGGGVVIAGGSWGDNRDGTTGWLRLREVGVSLTLPSVPGKRSGGPYVTKVSDLSERIGRIGRCANIPETAESLLEKTELFLIGGDSLMEIELVGLDSRDTEVKPGGRSQMRRRGIPGD